MFDQNQNSAVQPSSTDEHQSPLNKAQPASPSPASTKDSQEPEDIFSQTNPLKKQSASAELSATQDMQASTSSQNNQPAAPSSPTPPSAEPALKSPPSVFKKINSAVDNSSPVSNQPTSMPYAESTGKKNIKFIIVGIISVAVVVAASAAFWYFTRSSGEQQSLVPAETAELFNQPSAEQANSAASNKQVQPSTQPNKEVNNSNLPKDTDGDGLSDEEEAVLGTSLTSPDTDNDGLFDKEEVKVYKTDPLKADTDGDGYTDGEEVKNNFDPLKADQDKRIARNYQNTQYKFELALPENMVFEAQQNNVVRFNDNVNQIKLYIYINNTHPKDLTPDIAYTINEDAQGNLIITQQQSLPDKTPFSTDLSTNAYHAKNGLTYLVRYVATKRAPDHPQKFESILHSFKFIK